MERESPGLWSWMEPIAMRCGCSAPPSMVWSSADPSPPQEQPQHLCLDAAYDATPGYQDLLARHYQPHVRSRGEENWEKAFIPGSRARRWVVERSHAWLNRSRRLLVRLSRRKW